MAPPAEPCPSRNCRGRLQEWGHGRLEDLHDVTWSICDRCGRTVERVGDAPADHPTLFGAADA